MASSLHASTGLHVLRLPASRLAPGVGLLIGAGVSVALWAALIASVRALTR